MPEYARNHNEGFLPHDPLLLSLMSEEFNRVYMEFLERSRVPLSEEYRNSIRRTVCNAILPKIQQETLEPAQAREMTGGAEDFRDFLRREMAVLLRRFLRDGVFDILMDAA